MAIYLYHHEEHQSAEINAQLEQYLTDNQFESANRMLEPVRKCVFFLLCIQTDADFWDVQGHNTDLSRDMQHTSHGKGIPE